MVRRSSPSHSIIIPIAHALRYYSRYIPLLLLLLAGCSETPSTSEEHIAQGDRLLADGQLADAVAAYRMAMHQDTLNHKIYARLAKAYNAQHKKAAADRYLRRAMNITFDRGLRALEAGEDSVAIAAFEQTLDILPRHPLALTQLAEIHQAHGQSEKALLYLEKAAEANPHFDETFIKLGQLLASFGRADEAKQAFAKAIELDINAFRAYIGLGQVLLDEGEWLEAYNQFEKAMLVDPNSPAAHTGLAKALSNMKKPQSAER